MKVTIFSKSSQAKSLFLTVETVLNEFEDEASIVLEMFTRQKDEIETFLGKIMPSQVNLEGDLGFRYDESQIVSNLQTILKDQQLESSEMPSDLGYFDAKWQSTESIVIILDNLQFYLPCTLFIRLCLAFNLTPASPEDLNKRLKIAESMVLKPIKPAGEKGVGDENALGPTEDYTKYSSNLKANGKAKTVKPANNSSMLDFFKKTATSK